MATAEQLKSLIRSHFSNDRERFANIALRLIIRRKASKARSPL